MDDHLDERGDWPAALEVLLERHPRSTWPAGASAEAHFWLSVHEGFRRQCAALQAATDAYRGGTTTAHAYAALAAPLLRALLMHLAGHHQVEDFHYFPLLRAAVPRIAPAFASLEADHVRLQATSAAAERALQDLLSVVRADAADAAAQRHAAERYRAASEALCSGLHRHLVDEEDIVIPLLLERSRNP
jgi:iron-sulfur cluster repair protein YtfE (RIC family)